MILNKTTAENHKRYIERLDFYKKLGYDTEKERDSILEEAEPFSENILEVGTGKGHLALALAKQGFKFVTVDISQEEQNFARQNLKHLGLGDNVDFRIGNAEKLDFKANTFKTIICVNVLHHIKNPLKIIDEFIRVLSLDGKIILSDFSKTGLGLVDKAHTSEGRKHTAVQGGLKKAKDYLEGKDFKVKEVQKKFHDTLIVCR